MSTDKTSKWKTIFTASKSCGCHPKTTDIIEPIQKSKSSSVLSYDNPTPSSSDTSWDPHPPARNCCPSIQTRTTKRPVCPKIHDSLAVVKSSDDPYGDFRRSMLQMIFEKEIYSRDDLQQLLDCFLELNSPFHHDVIVRAFMEIWNGGIAAGDAVEDGFPAGMCGGGKVGD